MLNQFSPLKLDIGLQSRDLSVQGFEERYVLLQLAVVDAEDLHQMVQSEIYKVSEVSVSDPV